MQARKGKRYRADVLRFTESLEENLITLQNELIWKTYQVGRYHEFFVHKPKKRLVMALPFRDRVVQWAIYRQLNPLFDKRYINTSYACRVGHGTHRSLARVKSWIDADSYVLKMDAAKYFYRVDHDVLMEILNRCLADDDLLQLLEKIIRCGHTDFGMSLGSAVTSGNMIGGIGMPIGNLTSQMFANLYLNELDQHCKHKLKIKKYVRYMDDVLIIGKNKRELREAWTAIEIFLASLRLSLNSKTCIRSAAQGVEFCGFRIWPTHIKLKKKTALGMKRALKGINKKFASGEMSAERANASIASYGGLLSHGDCYGLIVSLGEALEKKTTEVDDGRNVAATIGPVAENC